MSVHPAGDRDYAHTGDRSGERHTEDGTGKAHGTQEAHLNEAAQRNHQERRKRGGEKQFQAVVEEPVAWQGPIVMNTQEELQRAYDELRRGTFIKR